jgi:hypothetical protein
VAGPGRPPRSQAGYQYPWNSIAYVIHCAALWAAIVLAALPAAAGIERHAACRGARIRVSLSQSLPALLPGVSSHSHDPRTDAARPAADRETQAGEQPRHDPPERREAMTDRSPRRGQPPCSGERGNRTRWLVLRDGRVAQQDTSLFDFNRLRDPLRSSPGRSPRPRQRGPNAVQPCRGARIRFSLSQSLPALLPGLTSHTQDPRTDAARPAADQETQAEKRRGRDPAEPPGATTDSSPRRRQPPRSGERGKWPWRIVLRDGRVAQQDTSIIGIQLVT